MKILIRKALMVFYTALMLFCFVSFFMYYHWSLIIFLLLSVSCYSQLLLDFIIDWKNGKFVK